MYLGISGKDDFACGQLSKNAACAPDVCRRGIQAGAQQDLWRPVQEGHNLQLQQQCVGGHAVAGARGVTGSKAAPKHATMQAGERTALDQCVSLVPSILHIANPVMQTMNVYSK